MKYFIYILLLFSLLMANKFGFSQDENEKQRTRHDFVFIKEAGGEKHLKVKLFTKDGPNFYPIDESPVDFYINNDTIKNKLGVAETDAEGFAHFFIAPDYKLDTIDGGYYHFSFEYAGNDTCEAVDDEIEVKNLNINYTYQEDSTSKTINVQLLDDFGNPAPTENLIVYVDRMHSKLPIKDDFTEDDGTMKIDFPMDLPGDSAGNLKLTYKVAESFDYGTVYSKDVIEWGTKVDYTSNMKSRALWAENTPLWMLIAITIVLVGAWSHFFIAIYHLFKMRKAN